MRHDAEHNGPTTSQEPGAAAEEPGAAAEEPEEAAEEPRPEVGEAEAAGQDVDYEDESDVEVEEINKAMDNGDDSDYCSDFQDEEYNDKQIFAFAKDL